MGDIAQLRQRIAVANAESKRLNSERQINIGKRETLKEQLASALSNYEKEYGVKLTEENLQSELDRVCGLKTAEIEHIESMLSSIKEGRYDDANALAGVVTLSQEQGDATQTVEEPSSTVDVSTSETTVSSPEPVVSSPVTQDVMQGVNVPNPALNVPSHEQPVASPASFNMPATPVVPTSPSAPASPSAPSMSEPIPQQPAQPSQPSQPIQPMQSEQPVQTAQPVQQSVSNFNAILGGTMFSPNGQ